VAKHIEASLRGVQMSYETKLERVVSSVQKAKGEWSCTLLIGAGCSVTANIPAGEGFVAAIKKEYRSAYDNAEPKTYPYCMSQLAPTERRKLIGDFIKEASLNWAHIAIAALVQKGYVDRVLTTNFDPLVVQACALLGIIPAVYDCAAAESVISPKDVDGPAVFHLHGQHTGPVLINTDDQMIANREKIAPVFDPSRENRTWIVVGYEGKDDPVFDYLAQIECFESCLYWVCHEKKPVPDHVATRLLTNRERYAYSVHGYDADAFFVKLAQQLDAFPPGLLENPFTHLNECLKPVPTHCRLPGEEEPVEFGADARKWIKQGMDIFEAEKLEVLDSVRKNLASERAVAQAEQLLLAGNYEKLADMHQAQTEPIAERLKDTFARGYFGWAYALGEQAEEAEGEEAERLLAQTIEKHEAALKIMPDYHEALNNWGYALYQQAKRKEGEEAELLFELACEKYEAALKIKPDLGRALGNWAAALVDHGALPHMGERSREMFELGKQKASEAERIKPGSGAYNVACASARLGEEEECRKWLETSLEHGQLPKRSHLEQDPDLESVRDTNWFKALLEKASS
jgi:hypothetical protein